MRGIGRQETRTRTLGTGVAPALLLAFTPAAVPAYLLAGLVGASRLEQDKHHLSDVVAGAALGYIVGRTVVRVNGRPIESESRRGAA